MRTQSSSVSDARVEVVPSGVEGPEEVAGRRGIVPRVCGLADLRTWSGR